MLRSVYETTTDPKEGEVANGWAIGPMDEAEVTELIGDDLWITARRFGVLQGFKTDDNGDPLLDDQGEQIPRIRQIDDFSEHFVNVCTTIADKIPVAGVDSIANFAKIWADKIQEGRTSPGGTITMQLSSGRTIKGILHDEFRKGVTKLVGKCIDLESAYKQCPIAVAHSRYSIFALKNPDSGKVEFFLATALPFGASAAVHGFNRAAMAINHMVHEYVGVPCTHYFDDFTVIVPETVAAAATELTEKFLDTLGWEVKKSKNKPMDSDFLALGVNFGLSRAIDEDPRIVVANKEERIKDIVAKIHGFLRRDEISPAEAAELRGKLVFSNSQTYGRMGALAYYHLGQVASRAGGSKYLGQDLRWALRWWIDHMENAKPRVIRVGKRRKPVYIFTDGSCDPCEDNASGVKAGYGAVMYDPEDDALELFGAEIGEPLLDLLTNGGSKKQIVGQSELIPCHAARKVWGDRLEGRLVVVYIDNEAARYALIKGSSPTRDSAWLVNEIWVSEAAHESNTWIERVPSVSNCADHPSRGRWEILLGRGTPARRRRLPPGYEASLVRQWKKTTTSSAPCPETDVVAFSH